MQPSFPRKPRFQNHALARAAKLAMAPAGLGLLFLSMPVALAAPQGGQVTAGQATIGQSALTTTITQSTARAAIDWQSFNVGARETVRIEQPSSNAMLLNRVVGQDPSAVLGRITANGQVLLLNPNGILFGRTAQVDVGGLMATTASLGNADFMAGRMQFSEAAKPGATVVNEGRITAADGGSVVLMGREVANRGVIEARLGRVSLASGDAYVLDLDGDNLIRLVVDAEALARLTDAQGLPLAARIDQTGQISAQGGQVQISAATAQRLLDNVINVGGVVRATSFAASAGRISLLGDSGTRVTLNGTLDVSGESAGAIEATGRELTLQRGASLDASATRGAGGSVQLGGGWQGGGGLAHAGMVQVQSGARINANASGSGDGGTVVLWSTERTVLEGDISARGAGGGRGGQVEVSSQGKVGLTGDVDAAGPGGLLLLDPTNVVIGSTGGALPSSTSTGDVSVSVDAVRRSLVAGTSVQIVASNDIRVDAAIDGRSASGGVAGGGLTLDAGRNLAVNANIVLNDAPLVLSAGGTLVQAVGSTLSGGRGAMDLRGAAGLQLQQLVADDAAVTLRSTNGAVSVGAPIVGLGSTGRAGALAVSGQSVSLGGGRVTSATITATGAGGLQIGGAFDATAAADLRSAASVGLAGLNAATIDIAGVTGAGSRAGAVTFNGVAVSAGRLAVASSQTVDLAAGAGVSAGQALSIDSAGRITAAVGSTLASAGATTLLGTALDLRGDLKAGSASSIDGSGAVTLGGRLVVEGAGGLAVRGASITQTGSQVVSAGSGALDMTAAAGNLSLQRVAAAGVVTLQAGAGDVTVAQAIVGPAPASDPTRLVDSAALEVSGRNVALNGGRFTAGARVAATAGTLSLVGSLDAGGAVELAATGNVTVGDVGASSLSVADSWGGTGAAGAGVSLLGNVATTGGVALRAAGLVDAATGSKLSAGGSILVRAGAIAMGAAPNSANPDDSGWRTTGTGSIDLRASGITGRPASIDLQSSLRTAGGAISVVADTGNLIASSLSGFGTAPGAMATLTAAQGSAQLGRAYGGDLSISTSTAGENITLGSEAVLAGRFDAVSAGSFSMGPSTRPLVSAQTAIDIRAQGPLTAAELVSAGTVALRSSADVTVSAPILGPGSTGRTGALTISGSGLSMQGGRVASASLTTTSASGQLRQSGVLDAQGSVVVSAAGSAEIGSVTANSVQLGGTQGSDSRRAGTVTLNGTVTSLSGDVQAYAVADIVAAASAQVGSAGALVLDAGGAINSAAGSRLVAAASATLTAGTMGLAGALQAGGANATQLTATGTVTVGDTAGTATLIKAAGTGALEVRASGFDEKSGAVLESGTGGTSIVLSGGPSQLTASTLTSTGGVALSGGSVSVAQAIVGPGSASASIASLTVTATAGSAQLLGGARVTGAVDVDAAAGVQLSDGLVAGGAAAFTSRGDVLLGPVQAASVKVADVRGGSGRAGGQVRLNGDLVSGGTTTLSAAGAFSTANNVQVDSAGPLSVTAASIYIAPGTGSGVAPESAGLRVKGASTSMTLLADGTNPSGQAAVQADGALRTEGGNLSVSSTGTGTGTGAGIRLASLQTVAPGTYATNGSTTLRSDSGDIVLTTPLGGSNTGYNLYANGYQFANRPSMGSMNISAPQGSVELNGLNLDGNQDPLANTAGLSVLAGRRLISNDAIAVNKGSVSLLQQTPTGGTAVDTDGVYMGHNVYSRGLDLVSGSAHTRRGYGVTVQGQWLVLFDNTTEYADVQDVNTYVTINGSGPSREYAYVNPRRVAKIIVGNNPANYSDQPDVLVPLSAGMPVPTVTVGGKLSGLRVADYSANSPDRAGGLHIGDTVSVATAFPNLYQIALRLYEVPSVSPDAADASLRKANYGGLLLKVLTFNGTGDVSTPIPANSLSTASDRESFGLYAPLGTLANVVSSNLTTAFGYSYDTTGVLITGDIDDFSGAHLKLPTSSQSGAMGWAFIGRAVATVSSSGTAAGTRVVFGPDTTTTDTGTTYVSSLTALGSNTTLPINVDVNLRYQGSNGSPNVNSNGTQGTNNSGTGFSAVGGFGSPSTGNGTTVPSGSTSPAAAVTNGSAGSSGGAAGSYAGFTVDNGVTVVPSVPADPARASQGTIGSLPQPLPEPAAEPSQGTGSEGSPRIDADGGSQGPGATPAAQADLGRGGARDGAAPQVFGRRYLLGRSSDPKVCAPRDLQPVGDAEKICKAVP